MTEPLITAEIDKSRLDLALRLFPRQLKMNLGDALDHIGKHFLKEWRAKRLQGPPGVRSHPRGLFNQFKRVMLVPTGGDINNMGLEIFTESKVARQHETGGTVTATGGGKLAVPLSARTELFNSRGQVKKKYKRPRDLANVVPIEFNGKTFLTKVKRRSREVRPLFVLKDSIRLMPRLGFMKTWDEQTNWRLERINKAVDKTLREV